MPLDKTLSPIDAAIQKAEEIFGITDSARIELLSRLKDVVNQVQFDPNSDSPLKLDAKLHVIQTLQGVLKDMEDGAVKRARINLQKKDTEINEDTKQMVGDFLKRLNIKEIASSGVPTIVPTDLSAKIDKAVTDTNHEISDGELVIADEETK